MKKMMAVKLVEEGKGKGVAIDLKIEMDRADGVQDFQAPSNAGTKLDDPQTGAVDVDQKTGSCCNDLGNSHS